MAGDWIKMRCNLWTDPRVGRLVDLTEQSPAAVVGGLYWLWSTADQHSVDGMLEHMTVRQVDRTTGIPGFGAALVATGWLEECPDGLRIPSFEEHNGSSATARAQTARRVAAHKAGNAADAVAGVCLAGAVTQCGESGNAVSVTTPLPREEKRREEGEEGKPSVASTARAVPPTAVGKRRPPCPAEQVVALYHAALPELPRVRVMTADRSRLLKRRWGWVLTSRLPTGERRAATAAEALEWFGRFFERARASDFLMGRSTRSAGHAGWVCDFDFLLGDKGLKAVVERTDAPAPASVVTEAAGSMVLQ